MSFLKTTAIQHLNASTPSISLTSNGEIGIGATSPWKKLQVGSYPYQDDIIAIGPNGERGTMLFGGNTTAGGGSSWVKFGDNASSAGGGPGSKIMGYGSGSLGFFTNDSGVATERMTIDSLGRVTKPYQPSFLVTTSSNLSSAQNIVWEGTTINVGGHYSTSTGRFTAPVAGKYWLSATMLPNSGYSGGPFFAIRKNNSSYVRSAYFVNADETVTLSIIMDMAVNDYATVYVESIGIEGAWSFFCGYLIG